MQSLHVRLWTFLVACAPSLLLLCRAAPESPPRNPTEAEIHALFSRVTRQAPEKFHFRARVQRLSPAWTEQAIQQALRSQEEHMSRHDGAFTAAERAELRETRLEGIRRAASGTNTYQVELWLSGELYRKDEIWTSIPNPSKWNHVVLGEPRFEAPSAFTPDGVFQSLATLPAAGNRVTGYVLNETLRSVTVYTNTPPPVTVDALWDGYGLEPPFGIQLIVALLRTNDLAKAPSTPRLRQLSQLPLHLDETRARQLATGSHPVFDLRVSPAVVEGRPGHCFTLEPKTGAAKEGPRYLFVTDAEDLQRLYRSEIREPGVPVLASTRTGYGPDGWPRFWRSESLDAKGQRIATEVEYLGDITATFDDAEIFAPVFPSEYAISVSAGSGVAELIHNPRKLQLAEPTAGSGKPDWLARLVRTLLIALVIWLPIALIQRRRQRQLARIEGQL